MPDEFTHELRQFVEHNIESVPQLEALLLLRKEPDRAWSASDIAKALYIQEEAAAALLVDFVRREFASYSTSDAAKIIYRARDQTTDRLIDELQAAYQGRRVAVISLIYSKPLNKVQTFADAFRFGKENPK
jgi:hypothetical protein